MAVHGKGGDICVPSLEEKILEYRDFIRLYSSSEPGERETVMTFRRSDLQEAFFVAGTHGFRVWGYGTTDPLDEVLRENYFEAAQGILRAGELIYVSTQRESRGNAWEGDAARVALVMVRDGERGTASVRLVQDFGGPDASTPAAVAPLKRGRGRPPGSKNRNHG